MTITPISLLERLRQPGQSAAWEKFVQLYTPLLFHWARRLGLSREDSADLVQDILAVLVRKLPAFQYDPERRFRGWLHTVAVNQWRENQRKRARSPLRQTGDLPPELAEPATMEDFAEVEYQRYLMRRALEVMQTQFQPTVWKACWGSLVEGRKAAEVAAELGISEGAVYVAKHRVLRRLREELADLLD